MPHREKGTGGSIMYYVIKGETTCFAARGPKKLRDDLKNHETMDIRTFDYDDTIIWIDDALQFERRRVKDDPYAMAALDAERGRRSIADENRHAPWFENAAAMIADFSLALEEESYNADEWDDGDDLTPVVKMDDLTAQDKKLIHEIAEFARAGKKSVDRYEDPPEMLILRSDFCQTALGRQDAYIMRCFNEVDIVEDLKDLSARLLFIYGEERGKKGSEDYFDAAMYLYRKAVELQEEIDDEDFASDEEDWEDEEGENPLEIMARLFSEHIRQADADDEFVAGLGEATDQFLAEKGFDLPTLAGLKAAQAWLEKAKVEEAFWSEGPIENAIDQHMGEARIAAMLKIVKARIEKRI